MDRSLVTAAAVIVDLLVGEPSRGHPLEAFGRLADVAERVLNRGSRRQLAGVVAVGLTVAPVALAASRVRSRAAAIGLVASTVASRSLDEHTAAVEAALRRGDDEGARRAVAAVVSRDADRLDRSGIVIAAVESLLENGNDAVFAPMFWSLVAGPVGAVAYRLVNTLDAMWGYRTERHREFGWAAARLDDLLNLIPARLTALTYLLLGDARSGSRCWREQGRRWKSPNAGPVMAAGAGALRVRLGGPAPYHGAMADRPILGIGDPPGPDDLRRARHLVRRGVAVWTAAALALGGLRRVRR